MSEDSRVIVFPTDFSDVSIEALPWVLDMAEMLDAAIHCVHVVEDPQVFATLDMGAMPFPTGTDLEESSEKMMGGFLAEHLGGAKTQCTGEVLRGRAANEIVSYADSSNAVAIVMATHGYSGIKHVMLGSTTEEVVRHAQCPVLSVRNGG
jgi:nucleotide-binding universal stress UspA family protein